MAGSLLHLMVLLTTLPHRLHGNQNNGHNASRRHDYCVLGAGPAGLQMGYFLQRAQRDYIILERNSGPGSFFNIYPRHRKLISINKIYTGRRNPEFNLRHDWNSLLSDRPDLLFQQVSRELYPRAEALPRYLALYEHELDLTVRYGEDVARVSASGPDSARTYTLTTQQGQEYQCRVLLVSTGLWVPQQVQFEGWELVEGYESIPVDPEQYRDQAVLILGKGNAAFETAQSILGRASKVHLYSPSPVRLAWHTHYVGDLRAVNNELLDTYQLKSLDGLVEGRLEDIAILPRGGEEEEEEEGSAVGGRRRKKRKKRREAGGRRRQLYLTLAELLQGRNRSEVKPSHLPAYHNDNFSLRQPYDRVIRCLGFRFNFSIFDSSARPPSSEGVRGRLPGVTAWYEGRGTPGLFVLGAAAHARDYRSSAGGFIHGFRYTVRAVHRLLEQRYHSNPWPVTKLWTNQLLSWLLRRVNEASGPYQMFSTLGDVVLLQGAQCEYLEEFPLQALPRFPSLSGRPAPPRGLLVLVLQYGLNRSSDPLGPGRAESEWPRAWRSNFLHPVLYFYHTVPTEREMRLRPPGWPLPRPAAIHHMIEDFLTEWEGPVSHSQPLRRFLEHCLQTDLRAFYAESCFRFSLTNHQPPLFCRQGYLRKQGLMGSRGRDDDEAWPHPSQQDSAPPGPSFPGMLTPGAASVSSPMNFDL